MELEDSGGGGLGGETVYGTHEDSHVVMSEKVQSLAGSIYQEFERMIARYDEDVVKTLMPLLVNVLECLDAAYQVNQEQDVELELLREDNEQLVTQYEREKGARKTAEQKLLEIEDAAEGERKESSARQESLESIVRMLELKHKNSLEHAGRLEERESDMKKEYAKLHERYTDLFKTHMDYVERTKLLLSGGQLSSDRAEVASMRGSTSRLQMGRSSGPVSYGYTSLEGAGDGVDSVPTSPVSSCRSSPSLHSEMDNVSEAIVDNVAVYGPAQRATMERSQETDMVSLEHRGTVTTPSTPPTPNVPPQQPPPSVGRSQTKREQRSANTLYQELSFQDADALADMDEGADITGGWVHPGEYASSGMGKEVENLIMENNELLATKNALNIVKDDLIVKVDELTSEQEMLREEIRSLKAARDRLRSRITELEEELRKVKEVNEARASATANNESPDDESDVPMAQRKRFTRVEMARVLMERNQYKERFMELQEAVRWTEMIRASRHDPLDKKSKQSIWKFFSNLFSSNDRPDRPLMEANLRYHAPSSTVAPSVRALPRPGQDFLDADLGSDRLIARRAVERRDQYRQVRAHVRKDDGRPQAYGWSLPGKVAGPIATVTPTGNANSNNTSKNSNSCSVSVPVPVYCRPLAETTPGMKIWCAAGVNLMGGHTKDGGLMVGGSVFYSDATPSPPMETATITEISNDESDIANLDRELAAGKQAALLETQLSSYVWICTSTKNASMVTVIDANNPAVVLDTFNVCDNHLLCIASVSGASSSDYTDTFEPIIPTQTEKNEDEQQQSNNDQQVIEGEIKLIENAQPAPASFSTQTNDSSDQNETKDNEAQSIKTNENGDIKDNSDDDVKVENDGDGKSKTSAPMKDHSIHSEVAMSSVLATMWLGTQNGELYVHSAVANWRHCLHSVQLHDAVLSIVQIANRVVTAIADGTVAVFRRDITSGQWNLDNYYLVRLGGPTHSVRCLTAVTTKVWCGYRNRIHVLDPRTLKLVHSLEAHPRRESQVRQLAWLGEGVWVSIRLDSTLRLYHAHTYQHLQDVDIEPYVSKMLGTGKLGFSFVRITALLISSNRLWIGTGNGVIISVPLSESGTSLGAIALRGAITSPSTVPGGGIRIAPTPGSYIPYCTMAHAQLSFHGHRDSVKFFVAVPGSGGMSAASTTNHENNTAQLSNLTSPMSPPNKIPPAMLVMSGGEGYIDFRIGDGDMEDSVVLEEVNDSINADTSTSSQQFIEQKGEKSHLIVWQVALT